MKKTSRRSFGKQIAGALVTLPIASSAGSPGASAQTATQEKPREPGNQRIFTAHDTPPPVLISDGSLVIESEYQFDESSSGNRHFYRGPGVIKPDIGHIRVFKDNGDKIYEDLYAEGSKIEIVWINEDKNVTGNVRISGGAVFEINSDKNLSRQSVSKRRRHKYDHPGQGGNKRIRIESIEIENPKGAKTKFTAASTGSAASFLPDEFRMLIWRH